MKQAFKKGIVIKDKRFGFIVSNVCKKKGNLKGGIFPNVLVIYAIEISI